MDSAPEAAVRHRHGVLHLHRQLPEDQSKWRPKDGYHPSDTVLKKSVSGWYVANILVGGIIGFIVDGANGAMWNRTPAQVGVQLEEAPKTSSLK